MKTLLRQSPGLLLAVLMLLGAGTGHAQQPERWFQVEVSVFSNERQADREEEVWSPERITLAYPDNLQALRSLFSVLMSAALQPEPSAAETSADNRSGSAFSESLADAPDTPNTPDTPDTPDTPIVPSAQDIRRELIAATGPFPPASGDGYRFPDFARTAFLQLPASESDFQQTNRALERSPEHRLLFHSVWRQPVPDPGGEMPVAISGGDRYGEHWELEGSLSFHFNANRDRVVVDSNLWLTEFTAAREPAPLQSPVAASPEAMAGAAPDGESVDVQLQEPDWQLPDLPTQLTPAVIATEPTPAPANPVAGQATIAVPIYEPGIIYHLEQSREMRSEEFHYVDHPALGLIVTVLPYEVPPLPETTEEQEALLPVQ